MNVFTIKGIRIDGIVACVPERKIDNETSLREMYGDEAKLIMESTGIRTRYLANPGTSSSDLCLACAKELIKGTNTAPKDIGAVVFVTFTPDRIMPFNAALIHEKLGLNKEIPSFDLSLACSGYAYGMYIASMFAKASKKKVLLLDGDIQSAYMSSYDKSTVPVMADAGSATLLVAGDISKWLQRFLAEINESADTISSFIPHQANMYMIKKLGKKLKFTWENTWQSGDAVGNSASATVPVTIAYDAAKRLKGENDNKVLIAGFGGGLSASAGVITLNPKAFYKFFQYEGKTEN